MDPLPPPIFGHHLWMFPKTIHTLPRDFWQIGQGSGFSPPPFLPKSELFKFSRYKSWPFFFLNSFIETVFSETNFNLCEGNSCFSKQKIRNWTGWNSRPCNLDTYLGNCNMDLWFLKSKSKGNLRTINFFWKYSII